MAKATVDRALSTLNPTVEAKSCAMIDIGANLLDPMYEGNYHDKKYHEPDYVDVLSRSWESGVEKIMITGTNLVQSRGALELAKSDDRLFCTVGCHPTECGAFDAWPEGPEDYLQQMLALVREAEGTGKVVAIGECGLDYDRLNYCDKETQLKYFEKQFQLAEATGLPMFLHMRAASHDFLRLLRQHEDRFDGGVVHSFDGSADELEQLLAFDKLSIGINGCSCKTEDNLSVVATIPLDRLMIETDSPWCEVRPSHASKRFVRSTPPYAVKDKKKHERGSLVRGRNEPCNLRQVLEVVAGCKGIDDVDSLASQIKANTERMFFKHLS